MATRIQLRRGTAAQWSARNPVLSDGEVGVEKDTTRFKIGNGEDHWNDLPYAPVGSGGGTTVVSSIISNISADIAFSAAGGSSTFQTLQFNNANGVTFSNVGGAIEASVAPGGGGGSINVSAGTTSNLLTDITFANANGISFGLNASTITASHDGLTSQSNQAFSADASSTFQTLSFQNSNLVSFSNNAGAIRVTHDLMASTSRPAFSADASSTFQTLTFQNSNQISFSNNAGAIRITHDLMLSTSRPAFSAGGVSSTFQTLQFQDSINLSFSNNAGSVRVTHNLAGTSTGSAANILGISMTHNSSGLNLSITTPVQTNQQMTMFATGNTTLSSTGTSNASSLIFRGSGAASVGITNGSILIDVAAGAAAITQSIGISTQTAGGATAGTSGYATGDDILYHFVPGSNITMSQSLNGASATLSIYGAAGGGGGATISSYENMPGGLWGTSAVTFGATSLSSAVAFNMPQAGSFSFLRIPVLMTMGSTTIATIASATATAQMGQSSTFNAVVYSVGVGASSKSLISVASGSGTVNLSGRISITNSTQGSYTLAYSGLVEGGGTTRTTQYSISNTNYSFTSQAMSEFSSNRFLDIPFANSLSAGAYWLVVGRSTSSSSAGVALSAMTSWGPRYSNHYAGTQGNLLFGVMGSTNMTSIGGLIGAGNFSTAGGGTTSALPMSAISSTASNPRMYFQLIRSA